MLKIEVMKLPNNLQALLNQSEQSLVKALSPQKLEKLSSKQVKQLHVRARRLQKKYGDLLKKQSRSIKETAGKKTNANMRTLKKVGIFEEAVRFAQKHLDIKSTKTPITKKKATLSKSKLSKKTGTARKPVAKAQGAVLNTTSKKARVSKATGPLKNTGLKSQNRRIRGHQTAAGKRKQARRDHR